jgi:xanthine dehydrogenase iron-sulfur cluster and FAD-binding subunit A
MDLASSRAWRGRKLTWMRPKSFEDLLQIKHEFPEARIVVGNTEIGKF